MRRKFVAVTGRLYHGRKGPLLTDSAGEGALPTARGQVALVGSGPGDPELITVKGRRLLARADWPDREPVLALWVWQCVVVAVLLCCALSMTLSAAAAWQEVRDHVFAVAPRGVVEAYAFGAAGAWAPAAAVVLACGGVWSAVMLVREILRARARRRQSEPGRPAT